MVCSRWPWTTWIRLAELGLWCWGGPPFLYRGSYRPGLAMYIQMKGLTHYVVPAPTFGASRVRHKPNKLWCSILSPPTARFPNCRCPHLISKDQTIIFTPTLSPRYASVLGDANDTLLNPLTISGAVWIRCKSIKLAVCSASTSNKAYSPLPKNMKPPPPSVPLPRTGVATPLYNPPPPNCWESSRHDVGLAITSPPQQQYSVVSWLWQRHATQQTDKGMRQSKQAKAVLPLRNLNPPKNLHNNPEPLCTSCLPPPPPPR